MSMNVSRDTATHPTKDESTCPEQDTRKRAHDDGSRDTDNNPPDHGIPTHGVGRFLWECDKRTPVDELGDLYRRWVDDSEQVDLGEWSA